jgi:hypothetical protein
MYITRVPYFVPSHLKILMPVGTAIIIVADVKYACVLMSILTVNTWCAHTTNPSNPIVITEQTIPTFSNSSFSPFRGRRYVRLYRILVECGINFGMPKEIKYVRP